MRGDAACANGSPRRTTSLALPPFAPARTESRATMPLRLHEFAHRIAALSDIEEIVAAMRSLAFVELRRLLETIAHQKETLVARERAIADLLAHFPQPLPDSAGAGDVLLAIGSE